MLFYNKFDMLYLLKIWFANTPEGGTGLIMFNSHQSPIH